jgi:ribosomal protein S18 acetylase RimI-like enzyme
MVTSELTWRALRPGDAPALTRLRAAVETVDRTGEHFSEQDVRDELEDASTDLDRDTLGALGPDGEFVAYARVSGSSAVVDVDRVLAVGAVLPAARGRGHGRRLLAWAEDRAATLHRERHPEVPGAVCVVVDDRNASHDALVRAAGYEAARQEYLMTRSLADPLPGVPPVPAGLTLTRYVAERDAAVRAAHRVAFSGHWGSTAPDDERWARWFTGSRAFRPDVSWLALDGDAVAAFLLSYFWEADAAATGVREAFVGQIGVRPEWRRRGLGALLLATALASYRAAGYERSALGVDTANATGALGLYERAGYTVKDRYTTWAKPLA